MAFRIIRKRKEARRLAKIEEIFQVIKCNFLMEIDIRFLTVLFVGKGQREQIKNWT